MAFINTLPEDTSLPEVKQLYETELTTRGYIPNYTKVFSHRPQVMAAWGNLLSSIRSQMDTRRYELVTLAAARALSSSYCMLAHGSILLKEFYSVEELNEIARNHDTAVLTPAETAMMAFAEQIVRDATAVTQADIDTLRTHGFSDEEIFDITATATARCFFSKTLDALGAEPDALYQELDADLRQTLTVGRPISQQA